MGTYSLNLIPTRMEDLLWLCIRPLSLVLVSLHSTKLVCTADSALTVLESVQASGSGPTAP